MKTNLNEKNANCNLEMVVTFKNIINQTMRLFYIFIAVIYMNCTNSSSAQSTLSAQDSLQLVIDTCYAKEVNAPNAIAKQEIRIQNIDTIDKFVAQALKFTMTNFNVTVKKLEVKDEDGGRVAYATFIDSHNNHYVTGVRVNDSNPTNRKIYQFIKTLREGSTYTICFHYEGLMDWKYETGKEVYILAYAFPKDWKMDEFISKNNIAI
jgi:hypothetical protein